MDTCAIRVPVMPTLLSHILACAFYAPPSTDWLQGRSIKIENNLTLSIALKPVDEEERAINHATVTATIQEVFEGAVKMSLQDRERLYRAVVDNDAAQIDTPLALRLCQIILFGEPIHG